jgi:DNA modification methylase
MDRARNGEGGMKTFHDGKITLHAGDCLDVLKAMPENSIDAVVTDPPYHLTSIVKRYSGETPRSNMHDKDRGNIQALQYKRLAKGFMGKQWDGGDIAFRPELWAEVLRVLKPGGHMVAFSGTRTYHRMAVAIEDAGFEIRDQLAWVFAQGFPKSHDVSKGIDRIAQAEREIIGVRDGFRPNTLKLRGPKGFHDKSDGKITAPATDAARQWQGYGTALKPSFEPLCLAQKPLNFRHNSDTIGSALIQLWSRLWLLWPANFAELSSALSPHVYGVDPFDSAQWSAEDVSNTQAALFARMDMSQFESALTSSLSTVSSWSLTWAESSEEESTFTTGTESRTTIDWKTLKSSLSRITPDSIIQAHKSGAWLNADASPAERYLSAVVTNLNAILELSAAENALSSEPTFCRDETDQIKPYLSDICLARKPLSKSTVAANVLRWGTGALNIDGTRIGIADEERSVIDARSGAGFGSIQCEHAGREEGEKFKSHSAGRWPTNLCHDGSPEVLAGFPETTSGNLQTHHRLAESENGSMSGKNYARSPRQDMGGDSGSAARFFYTAKADSDDRLGSRHPTVKPVDLMQWLVKLVCPKGATVLDPFAGTGTTGAASFIEGRRCVLIEREAEYLADIEKRMGMLLSGSEERSWKLAKPEPLEALPLFALPEPAG